MKRVCIFIFALCLLGFVKSEKWTVLMRGLPNAKVIGMLVEDVLNIEENKKEKNKKEEEVAPQVAPVVRPLNQKHPALSVRVAISIMKGTMAPATISGRTDKNNILVQSGASKPTNRPVLPDDSDMP